MFLMCGLKLRFESKVTPRLFYLASRVQLYINL